MDNNIQINQLIHARKLSSDKECKLFQDALQKLQGSISINDIYNICQVFYDDTENDEMMFAIIHMIEQLQGEEYLKCIALYTPDMVEAHDWAMTLNKRIINSSKYFEKYIEIIRGMDQVSKEKILKLLVDIENDNPKRFSEKISIMFNKILN